MCSDQNNHYTLSWWAFAETVLMNLFIAPTALSIKSKECIVIKTIIELMGIW
jgi:hypothetical protein